MLASASSRVRRRRWIASWGLAVALVVVTAPGLAADPPTAAGYLKQGLERFSREDYEGARAAFDHAYHLEPVAGTLFNLALSELRSGHPLEAVRHLRAYLEAPDALPDKASAVRAKLLPRAEAQTARLQIDAPNGAAVVVDGVRLGSAPLTSAPDVGVGDHEVVAALGLWTQSLRVSAKAGEAVAVHFTMPEPSPVSPVVPPPPAAAPVPASQRPMHEGGGGPSTAKVVTFVVGGSLAVAAGSVGLGFSVASASSANHAAVLRAELPSSSSCAVSPRPSACAPLAQDNANGQRDYWLGVGFYVAGGVLAASTLATLFLWPNEARKQAWTLSPMLAPRAAGAALSTPF